MGSLVGIDVGVLDNDLLAMALGQIAVAAQQSFPICGTVQPDVDVSVAGNVHGRHAGNRPGLIGELGRDLAGRLPELFCELERGRNRKLAELALPRLFDVNRQVDTIAGLYMRVESAGYLLF